MVRMPGMGKEMRHETWEIPSAPAGIKDMRIMSHERGNPDTEVGRNLKRISAGMQNRPKEDPQTALGKSD